MAGNDRAIATDEPHRPRRLSGSTPSTRRGDSGGARGGGRVPRCRPRRAGMAATATSAVMAASPATGHAQRAQRHLLLPALQAVQRASGGSAKARSPTSASGSACRRPRRTVWRPSTRCSPRRLGHDACLHVCDDIACQCRGATEMVAELERTVGPSAEHAPQGDHVPSLDPDEPDLAPEPVPRPLRPGTGGAAAGGRRPEPSNGSSGP